MSGKDVMPLPKDVRPVVDALVGDFARISKTVSFTQVALHGGKEVPGWVGAAADAYTDQILKLGGHARKLPPAIATAIVALHEWSATVGDVIERKIPPLWDEYDGAEAEMHARQAKFIHGEGGQRPTPAEISANEAVLRSDCRQIQAGVVARYGQILRELDGVADAAAKKMKAAREAIVDSETLAKGRDAVGAVLFDDMPLVDGQAEWAYAQHSAAEAAKIVNDPDVTPEKVQKFEAKYGEMCKNPFFAQALASRVPPKNILRFQRLAYRHMTLPSDSHPIPSDYKQRVESLTRHLGNVFVLSTGGMNADPSVAHDQRSFFAARAGLVAADGTPIPQMIGRRLEEWKAVGKTLYKADGSVEKDTETWSGGNRSRHYGYEYLADMMGSAAKANPNLALGPECFDGEKSIAKDILKWDHLNRKHMGGLGSFCVTAGRQWGRFDAPSGHDETGDAIHSMLLLMDHPESLESDDADGMQQEDREALRESNRGRLNSVRSFLASDTGFDVDLNNDGKIEKGEGHETAVTRYLTGHRQDGPDDEYKGFQDHGEQYGRVLQQASAREPFMAMPEESQYASHAEYQRAYDEWRAWQARNENAASIALNHMRGYQEGLENPKSRGYEIGGQNAFGYYNSKLRSWTGLILQPYVEDITNSMYNGRDGYGVSGGAVENSRLHFPSDFRMRIFGKNGMFADLGFDEPAVDDHGTPNDKSDDTYVGGRAPAIDNLLIAAKRGYTEDLNQAFAEGGDPDEVRNVSARWAPITEGLFTAPKDSDVAALEALDKRNARWQRGVSFGIDFSPVGLATKNPVGGFIMNQVKSRFSSAPVMEAMWPTNNAAAVEGEMVTKEMLAEKFMTKTFYSVASTHDVFQGASPTPAEYSAKISGEKPFVDANGKIIPYDQMTPKQRGDFEEYVSSHAGKNYGNQINDIQTAITNAAKRHHDARVASK